MGLFIRALYLGIISAPFVFIMQIVYSLVVGIIFAIPMSMLSIGAAYIPPLVMLVFVFSSLSQAVIEIGTLRPTLQMAGYPSELRIGYLIDQMWIVATILFLRSGLGLMLMTGLAVYLQGFDVKTFFEQLYGADDPQSYFTAEVRGLFDFGENVARAVIWFLGIIVLLLMVEALFVVPIAKAAFASGREGAHIRGFTGVGHRWFSVFVTRCFTEAINLIGAVTTIYLILDSPRILASIQDTAVSVSQLGGTISEKGMDSAQLERIINAANTAVWAGSYGVIVALTILGVVVTFLANSLKAGVSAAAFESWMKQQGIAKTTKGLAPAQASPLGKGAEIDIRSLRKSRMRRD